MEEVESEWILEGYLQPTLAGLKVFLKCQTFSFLFAYATVVVSLMLVVYNTKQSGQKAAQLKINLHLFLMYVFYSVSNEVCDKYGFEGSGIPRLHGGLWSSGNLWSRTL